MTFFVAFVLVFIGCVWLSITLWRGGDDPRSRILLPPQPRPVSMHAEQGPCEKKEEPAQTVTSRGFDYLKEKQKYLLELRDGWLDGEGKAIDSELVHHAFSAMVQLYRRAGIPIPNIFPTESGGVSFQWNEGDLVNVEIEFSLYGDEKILVDMSHYTERSPELTHYSGTDIRNFDLMKSLHIVEFLMFVRLWRADNGDRTKPNDVPKEVLEKCETGR